MKSEFSEEVRGMKNKIIKGFIITSIVTGATIPINTLATPIVQAETQNSYVFLTENDLTNSVKQAMPSFLDKNRPYGMYVDDYINKRKIVIPSDMLDSWYTYPQMVNEIKNIFRASYTNYVGLRNIQIGNSESAISSLRQVGTPVLLHSGTSELVNLDSANTRNLVSAPFSKAFTSSSTVTVTNGVNLGYKIGTKVGFKIGDVGVDVNTEFSHNINWATANATSNSSTDTYTAPAQTIAVPPRSKAIVTYTLQKQAYVGDIELKGDLTGSMILFDPYIVSDSDTPDEKKILYTNTLYDIFDKSGVQLPAGLSLDRSNQKIKFKGAAKIQADVGQKYLVEVKIVSLDNPNNITKEFTREVTPAKSH